MKNFDIRFCLVLLLALLFSCKSTRNVLDDVQSSHGEEEVVDSIGVFKKEFTTRELEYQLENYRASRQRDFDLIHMDLDLSLDYEKQEVNGLAILTLKPYFFSQKEILLDAKDFDIWAFGILEGTEVNEINFRYNGKQISGYLPKEYSSDDTLKVRLRYTAKPNENSGLGSRAISDTKGLYFINADQSHPVKPRQVWTQGETEHNSKWFPTIDSPNERMTHDIKVTVEEQFRTLSNGDLIDSKVNEDGTRTDHWHMDMPHAPYLVALVVGEFAEIKDRLGDLEINYYVESQFEEGAKIVFKDTPEMIRFFSEILGVDYPWQRYNQVVVRDFVSGAMENTTLTIFMEELNLDEKAAIDSEWEGIIAHELFHQWFGNLVTTESWANLTLNEAFATYSEYLWYEYKHGKDEADLHQVSELESYLEEARVEQKDLVRFYYDDPEDMFDRHSYAKGGAVLHMLRRYLGDEAFFASLKHYLEKHAYSSVEIHDLRLAFEEITGMDLNWFFNQWFLASGHPVLEYDIDYSQPENLLITVAQRQDFHDTPLCRIPFKVSWYEDNERKEKTFVLDRAWQQFALENGKNIGRAYFDEASELLAEKKSYRGKNHFRLQFENSQLGVARYEAMDSLAAYYFEDEATRKILISALEDEFWAIRELALYHIGKQLDWIRSTASLEERIYEMAETDSRNSIRLASIELLANIDAEKYSQAFLRWMNDPSYFVAGAALGAYLENPGNSNRKDVLGRFEGENNIRMLVPVATYFIEEDVLGKGEWFHGKFLGLGGRSLYYFLGYYGEYFTKNPEEGSEVAVENLISITANHPTSYIRIGALNALLGFIDDPRVLDRIKSILEDEQDEMVKNYGLFFLSPYFEED